MRIGLSTLGAAFAEISAWIVALTLLIAGMNEASAEAPDKGPCTEDAMIVFDASGSMSGDGWG
jgi:Ca-activated chloride channel homolog